MAHTLNEELQLWEFAKVTRTNHDSQWDRISRFLFPYGGDFQSIRSEGQQRNREIYDNSPSRALFKSGAILEALFAPRHTKWQSIKTIDPKVNERHEVQEYFEQVRNVLFESRDSGFSDFYGQKAKGYLSTSAFGNECMLVEETAEGRIRYESMAIQDVWVVYNELKKASVFYVQFKMSAFAAHRRWGKDSPKSVMDAVNSTKGQGQWEELMFLHVIRPRDGVNPNPTNINTPSNQLPFASLEIDLKGKELIKEGGFFELPFQYSRNIVVPGESYGRGFGDQVLPDTATLQTQERIFLGMGERAMAPALLTTEEGPFGYGQTKLKVGPDTVIYGGLDDRGNVLMRPLDNGARLDLSETMMEQKRTAIEDTFLVNLFQLFQDTPMTAREVMVRLSERGQLIAPLAGSQESELFEPMTQREIAIHFRNGRLPEMPDALKEIGGKISLVYDNQATRFTRAEKVVSIQNGMDFIANVAQFDPSVTEIPDWHRIVREAWELTGSGASNLRPPDEVEASIAAQAEAADAQAATQAIPGLASAGKDLVDAGIIDPEDAQAALQQVA